MSIKIINRFAGMVRPATTDCLSKNHGTLVIQAAKKVIFGDFFSRFKDKTQILRLTHKVQKEYKKAGIEPLDIIKAESAFQEKTISKISSWVEIPFASGNKPHPYWVRHRVQAPFMRKTMLSKFKDKDVLLDMLVRNIYERKFVLQNDIILIAQGCDNNDAAASLQIFLELIMKKKTCLLATDISLDALSKTRGLDLLIKEKGKKNGRPISGSAIVLNDAFNPETPLIIKRKGQRIALPFRLGAIVPYNKVEMFLSTLIKTNDIVLISFFADAKQNLKVLQTKYFPKYCEGTVRGIPMKYLSGASSNTMCLWGKKNIIACIKKMGATIIEARTVQARDDLKNKITFVVLLIKRNQLVAEV